MLIRVIINLKLTNDKLGKKYKKRNCETEIKIKLQNIFYNLCYYLIILH